MSDWVRGPHLGSMQTHQWHRVAVVNEDGTYSTRCGLLIGSNDEGAPGAKAHLLLTDAACDRCTKLDELDAAVLSERDPVEGTPI